MKALNLRTKAGANRAKMVKFQDLFQLRPIEPDDDLSASDQRHLAAARKLELETSILNGDHVPLSELLEIAGELCDIVTRDVELWHRNPVERTEIIARLKEKLTKFLKAESDDA